jgi:hypothetical protein
MSDLFTKEGDPLTLHGKDVFDRSGRHVGQIHRGRIYDASGRYAATIVGDRAVYRTTDSSRVGSPFTPRVGIASSRANRAASAIWGQEPRW